MTSNWRPSGRVLCTLLVGIAALWFMLGSALGENGSVGEYNATTGAAINADLITGLTDPLALALKGNKLLVANSHSGTVGEYNATTGVAINADLITGLTDPRAFALSGNNLFVAYTGRFGVATVGEYNATTGAAINTNFITGRGFSLALAVSRNNNLFVATSVPVPEPSTWGMIAIGGVALLGIRHRKKYRTA